MILWFRMICTMSEETQMQLSHLLIAALANPDVMPSRLARVTSGSSAVLLSKYGLRRN